MSKVNKYDLKRYEREYEAQKALIDKGRWHFALLHGSIFGILMFVFMAFVSLSEHTFREAFLSKEALIDFIIWYYIGGLLGHYTLFWYIHKYALKYSRKKLEKYKHEHSEQHTETH